MGSFWKIFLNGIPLGLGITFSLIAITYVTKIVNARYPEEEIAGAIFFGLIGFPLILASSLRIIDKYKQN